MRSRNRRRRKVLVERGSSDLVSAAIAYVQQAHRGERLKYVDGIYYTHVKAVSRRMRTTDEKVVALFHDVVENRVKRELGKNPDPVQEEALIQKILVDIDQYFKNCGQDISSLIPDIDILTKRVTDADNYKGYIRRLADYAETRGVDRVIKVKLADLYDNMNPNRNPAFSVQTEKDKNRLSRYRQAAGYLERRFPTIRLRSAKPANRSLMPGRPDIRYPKRAGRRLRYADE